MAKHKGGGTNRHRVRYVCNACRITKCCSTRFSIRLKDLRRNSFIVACPCCGETERLLDIEAIRVREYEKRKTCRCGIIPFPHPKNMLGCIDYPIAPDEWTEEQHQQFQGMIETNRLEDG